MLDFLFKKKKIAKQELPINEIYAKLKELYKFNEISQERKTYLSALISKYGYLPYPHIKALEELTPAEILFGLEIKWGAGVNIGENEVFDGIKFTFKNPSVLARNGVKNANWIKQEGHDIKLINLAALGNGNKEKTCGKFISWLTQLLILPAGNIKKGIFSTTMYLVPFHVREFGCAYLPKSSDVSDALEDSQLKEILNLDAKKQVQLFIIMAQLAGHPVIYDVLPQTGRFAKIVLANPEVARWFDIKALTQKIENCIELVGKELERKFDKEDVNIIKNIYKQGGSGDLSEDYQKIYDEFEKELIQLKKVSSSEMLKREEQIKIQKRVKDIVLGMLEEKTNKKLTEDDITNQNDIIAKLIDKGLWSAPGGAWCSSGVPAFEKMSDCECYPVFRHYDFKGKDVTDFANLDCQTPYYFAFLENGKYNTQVIDIFIDFMKNLQAEYNFDGFRVDHVDHVVDDVSQKKGKPISYRIPAKVLTDLNSQMKSEVPYFAALAEYMLGGNFLKEYHEDMKFDVLWGNDIVAQSEKTPEKIIEDNQILANYNTKNFKIENLSILKTYNNQDGEFHAIDRYPGQLGAEGALFKWFKYKFLPGGKYAQRPIFYVDGDESFTKTGIENTIVNEVPLPRQKNYDFFTKFDAINRFAKSQELVIDGEAQIITQDEDGFVSWLISKEPLKQALLIAANYHSPSEKFTTKEKNGKEVDEIKYGETIENKTINLPGDYEIKSEFVFNGIDFVEETYVSSNYTLTFKELKPGEFRVFSLTK